VPVRHRGVRLVRSSERAGDKLYLSLQDRADPTRFLHVMMETVEGVTFERFSPVGPA